METTIKMPHWEERIRGDRKLLEMEQAKAAREANEILGEVLEGFEKAAVSRGFEVVSDSNAHLGATEKA